MASLTLTRFSRCEAGIFSHLLDDQKNLIAVTIEHAYQQPDGSWAAKIPTGTFTCVRGTHQLSHGDPFETFEVMGVPGHTGILFHCGNDESASSGCILLGTALQGDFITESRKAFSKFMDLMDGVQSFDLIVS